MVLRLTNKTNEIPVEDFDFKFWHFNSYRQSSGGLVLQSKEAAQKKDKAKEAVQKLQEMKKQTNIK